MPSPATACSCSGRPCSTWSRDGVTDAAPVACSACGRQADGAPPITWASATGPRGTTWTCEVCTRRHLRAMEAKLDEELW